MPERGSEQQISSAANILDQVLCGRLRQDIERWRYHKLVLREGRGGRDYIHTLGLLPQTADRKSTISATGSKLWLCRWKSMAQRLS